MNKLIITLSLICTLIIVGCSVKRESNITSISDNKPACLNSDNVADFEYSFKRTQDPMTILHYSQPSKKGSAGFDLGYIVYQSNQEALDYFNEMESDLQNFSSKYPDKSQTLKCSISGREGICGIYNGKIDTFMWVDDSTYKITNNFAFPNPDQPSEKLKEIVKTFSNCSIN